MTDDDRIRFVQAIAGAYVFFGQELTEFHIRVWADACAAFTAAEVEAALAAHLADPQRGAFLPRPADVVRLIRGDGREAALLAWQRVLEEVRDRGSYSRPDIDEPSRRALDVIGGWGALCRSQTAELPHLQRRFCEAYGVYADRIDRAERLQMALDPNRQQVLSGPQSTSTDGND